MRTRQYIELFGWIGALLILLMFTLNSLAIIHAQSTYYQIGNLIGAVLIAAASMVKRAWPAAFLNISWGLIAVVSLIRGTGQF
ncbi:CBU_0592 family membrane protein [Microbulbifer epialgicus]|uniref:CBU-0592-like domain-containing protein n=1 Tax=Microbulbifer epialgicus TaxID=393907 RepID=A0ABV4NZX3_9GAMM